MGRVVAGGPGSGDGGGGPGGEAGDGIVWYCTILYYTLLYCTILFYTVLYCTIQVVEQQGGARGGARWSKEQGGREGAEYGVDYQVWSSVQAIFPARDIRYHSRGGGERKIT